MITILEGPDGVGKTYMAKKIAGGERTYIHYGRHLDYTLEARRCIDDIYRETAAINHAVFDRSPISEWVYAKYRSAATYVTSTYVDNYIRTKGFEFIFVTASFTIIKEMVSRTKQDSWVADNIEDIYADYNLLMKAYCDRSNVRVFDNTQALLEVLNVNNNAGFRDASNNNTK